MHLSDDIFLKPLTEVNSLIWRTFKENTEHLKKNIHINGFSKIFKILFCSTLLARTNSNTSKFSFLLAIHTTAYIFNLTSTTLHVYEVCSVSSPVWLNCGGWSYLNNSSFIYFLKLTQFVILYYTIYCLLYIRFTESIRIFIYVFKVRFFVDKHYGSYRLYFIEKLLLE